MKKIICPLCKQEVIENEYHEFNEHKEIGVAFNNEGQHYAYRKEQ